MIKVRVTWIYDVHMYMNKRNKLITETMDQVTVTNVVTRKGSNFDDSQQNMGQDMKRRLLSSVIEH